MFATRRILAGEEIVAEAPLMDVPIALKDVYNPNHTLNERIKYNISRHLEEAYYRVTAEKGQAIENLFTIENDLLSVFRINAFEGELPAG